MVGVVVEEVAEVSMQSFDVVEEAEEGVPNMMEPPVDMLRKYSVVAAAVGVLLVEVEVEAEADVVDEKMMGDMEAHYSVVANDILDGMIDVGACNDHRVAGVVVEGLHEAVDIGIGNEEVLEVEVERNFVDEAGLN